MELVPIFIAGQAYRIAVFFFRTDPDDYRFLRVQFEPAGSHPTINRLQTWLQFTNSSNHISWTAVNIQLSIISRCILTYNY